MEPAAPSPDTPTLARPAPEHEALLARSSRGLSPRLDLRIIGWIIRSVIGMEGM